MKSAASLKRFFSLFCAIFTITMAVYAQIDQKPVLAVLALTSETVSLADAKSILSFIQQEFFNTQKYQLMERARIEKLLQDIHFQQSVLCDIVCIAKIGKQLAAQKVVTGTLSKLGNAYSIQLTMIDVATSTVESMYSSLEECPLEQLPGRITNIVNGLIKPESRPRQLAPPNPQPLPYLQPSTVIDPSEPKISKKKSPFLALTLSIVPGLGQYYNGHVFKGIFVDVLVTVGLVFLIGGEDLSRSVFGDPDTMPVIGGCMIAAAWSGSLIDAPISAARINRKSAQTNAHMLNFPIGSERSLGLDIGPVYKGYAAKLTFSF